MWFQKDAKFVYFFFSESGCINNSTGKFISPFEVEEESKLKWASNGHSFKLAPELITYWDKDNAL